MNILARKSKLSITPSAPYEITNGPADVSIINNMMLAKMHGGNGSATALTYRWFYYQVRNRGPWDFKYRGRHFENFGNFHYGAVGTAAGIPEQVLLRAAGLAQSHAGSSATEFGYWLTSAPYGDDPLDQYWIRAGIEYAIRSGF